MRMRRNPRAILGIAIVVMSFSLGARSITASAHRDTDSNWYHMFDQQTNKCLDNWGSTTAGTQIRQYNCWNGKQQLWRTIYSQGDLGTQGWFVIENQFSSQCIWVSGNRTTTNGAAVVQEPCNYNFTSLASMGENWYFEWNEANWAYYFSAVCVGQSACGGSYGAPTSYFMNETTKTNGAGATILYGSGQTFQGPY
jgi:hypothetical protein